MKLDPYLTLYANISSKWIKDFNRRLEIIKLLNENKGEMLLNTGFGNDFLDLIPKVTATDAKINKCNYIKLKSFCTVEETINKMKRQPMEWEKIFAHHTSNQRLISKIYEELTKLKKQIIQFKNRQRT